MTTRYYEVMPTTTTTEEAWEQAELSQGHLIRRHYATRGDANRYLTQTLPEVTGETSAEAHWELRRMIAIVEAWQAANRELIDSQSGDKNRTLLEPPDDWDNDPSVIYLAAKYRLTILTHPDLHRLEGDWLRGCRQAHDITPTTLAKRLKVDGSTIARWETGTRKVSGTNHRKLRLIFQPLWETEHEQARSLLMYRAVQRIAHDNGDNPFIGLEPTDAGPSLNWATIDNYLDDEDLIDGEPIHRRIQAFIHLFNARDGIPRPPWTNDADPIEEAGFAKPQPQYWTAHARQKYRLTKIDKHLGSAYNDGGNPIADNGSGNL